MSAKATVRPTEPPGDPSRLALSGANVTGLAPEERTPSPGGERRDDINVSRPATPSPDSRAPGGTPFLPLPGTTRQLPIPGTERGLSQADPELYAAWREHIRDGFQRNNEMFSRVLDAFMTPYYTTVWMYRILFGVGVVSFLVAAGLSIWTGELSFSLVFGGISVLAFVSYFISNPLRSLEENLEFITWLGLVYNSYWSRLAYMLDENTVQKDLAKATRDATSEIERIIDKHAEMSGKRPRLS